jgi:hypothetical protein
MTTTAVSPVTPERLRAELEGWLKRHELDSTSHCWRNREEWSAQEAQRRHPICADAFLTIVFEAHTGLWRLTDSLGAPPFEALCKEFEDFLRSLGYSLALGYEATVHFYPIELEAIP